MKKLFNIIVALAPLWGFAQSPPTILSGRVVTENFTPLSGVFVTTSIKLPDKNIVLRTLTFDNGRFSVNTGLTLASTSQIEFTFEFLGYKTLTSAYEGEGKTYRMVQDNINLETVTISSSVLSDPNTPIANHTLNKAEIEKLNLGQDLPVLLNTSPSLVFTTDAGAGVGYTSLRIRGSDQTRINVTVNGIPLNDPESQGVFWVNMPDFASSANRIDIQRGVGTSTNGAGAFGANINIETFNPLHHKASAEVNNSLGSFNTRRHNVVFNSGMLGKNFSMEGRLSRINSDGYLDRAFSELSSYYLSGKYISDNKKFTLTAIYFSGKERTYQAWWGTPESRVWGTRQDMEDFADRNFLSPAERNNLLYSGRNYNYYTYENETDNYQQDHFQLHGNYKVSENLNLSVSGFYVKGAGYYEQFREDDRLSRYGLSPITVDTTTFSRTDIIRQRWLDNDYFGGVYGLIYKKDKTQIQVGGGANRYIGDHFGEIIWAGLALEIPKNTRYYFNQSIKDDVNNFVKITQQFNRELSIYADMQYRWVHYRGQGFDQNRVDLDFDQTFHFLNPKAGLNYFKNKNRFYLSAAVANREPVRRDFVDAVEGETPQHESLIDYEAGWARRTRKYSIETNLYFMDYYNQLVLTGEINDVGGFVRRNAGRSYRAGIEIQASTPVKNWLTLSGNITLSDNRIKEYRERVQDWFEVIDEQEFIYRNTPIAYSPNIISALVADFSLNKDFTLSLIGKYVSKQYLDNTGREESSLPHYATVDMRMAYKLPTQKADAQLVLLLNNLGNTLYSSNGYTYKYFLGDTNLNTERMLYPQAGRNFLVALNVRF